MPGLPKDKDRTVHYTQHPDLLETDMWVSLTMFSLEATVPTRGFAQTTPECYYPLKPKRNAIVNSKEK